MFTNKGEMPVVPAEIQRCLLFRAHDGETKEQALARMLKANPALYAFYRAERLAILPVRRAFRAA
jgi:hypothetical protein